METRSIEEMTLEDLQQELKEMKESRDYWMDRTSKAESKFSAFRDMVKGLVVLVD